MAGLSIGRNKSKTRLKNILTPKQGELLNKLGTQVAGQVGKGAEVYGGQIAPGPSQLQQQTFAGLSGAAGQNQSAAIQNLISTGGVDPSVREKVYDAQRRSSQLEFDDFARQIEERYNAQGAGRSGGLQRSLGRGAARFGTNLANIRAGLEMSDEQRRVQGIQSGLGAYNQQVGTMMGAGGEQRAIEGQQLGENFYKWQAGQAYANPWLQYTPQVLGTQAMTPVTNTKGFNLGGLGPTPGAPFT